MARETYGRKASTDDVLQQIVERLIRVETRATNMMRAQGLLPTVDVVLSEEPRAIYDDGKVYVSNPQVSLADVSMAAVKGIGIHGGRVKIIVLNHEWGEIVIKGKGKAPGGPNNEQ